VDHVARQPRSKPAPQPVRTVSPDLAGLDCVLRGQAGPDERARAVADWLKGLVPEAKSAKWLLDPAAKKPAATKSDLLAAEVGTGRLLLELPADLPAERRATVEVVLALAAQCLGLWLRNEALAREQASALELATLGEAMLGAAHGLNNSLNAIVLQAALAQSKVPEELRDLLGPIRTEGAAAAQRLRPLLAWRQQHDLGHTATDLNAAVRALGAATLKPGPNLPAVHAQPEVLRHLLRVLVQQAAAQADGAPVCVVTEARAGRACLMLDPEPPAGWPDADRPADDLNEELRRSAVRSLLRRLDAAVEEGGSWAVSFPAVPVEGES
jgi:signal transduction histidine kinase